MVVLSHFGVVDLAVLRGVFLAAVVVKLAIWASHLMASRAMIVDGGFVRFALWCFWLILVVGLAVRGVFLAALVASRAMIVDGGFVRFALWCFWPILVVGLAVRGVVLAIFRRIKGVGLAVKVAILGLIWATWGVNLAVGVANLGTNVVPLANTNVTNRQGRPGW